MRKVSVMQDPLEDDEDLEEDIVDGEEDDAGGDDDEAEFSFIGEGGTAADSKFDRIVGALEEVLMDEAFNKMQEKFFAENCSHFDNSEENKLIYTDIFKNYTTLVEGHIEKKLTASVKDFSMEEFMEMLKARGEEELSHDVFDVLTSLGDFDAFKELMLSHKAGGAREEDPISPKVSKMKLYKEEMEDGEELPDLNLCITGVGPAPKLARPPKR